MFARKKNSRLAVLAIATAATFLVCSPASLANPIRYGFSVNVTSGPLTGNTYQGNFSYDSSSIIPGGSNDATGLLTSLNFTFNGITYDASMANTGALIFNSSGDLTSFMFGTDCQPNLCSVYGGQDSWTVAPGLFVYSVPGWSDTSVETNPKNVTFAPTALHVPEPGSLGMFGFGFLLLLLTSASRRRWTFKRIES